MSMTTTLGGSGYTMTMDAPATGSPADVWANRARYQTVAGNKIRFTDVGGGTVGTGGGSEWVWNGTRWKLNNGNALLDSIDTANSSIANTVEQQLNPNHALIPAGVIRDFDRIRAWLTLGKSAASETCTFRLRFGPAGTTADPVIATITSLAVANRSDGILLEFKRTSATTLQKQGNADTTSSFSGANTGALPSDVAVSSMDTNGMYLSLTSQVDVGAEIITVQNFTLELFSTDS